MPLSKLNLTIPQEGYSFADSEVVLGAKLGPGLARTRLDMLGAPLELNLSLILEPDEYQYWRAFWRSTILYGSLPFLLDLIIESADMTEYQVKIVPGTLQMGGIRGEIFGVDMRLEVKPLPDDVAFDESLVAIYGIYGAEADQVLDALAKLVNYDLPTIMP